MDLARYCLNDLGMRYVLLGKFQSDPLEGRFGYYRQLNGGNYYLSVRQLVENERKIRAISLIKFSQCSIQELKSMEATSYMAGTRDLVAKFVTHTEKSISQFEENFEIPDLNVLFFVAGALSRSELNMRRGCSSCSDCLLENRQGTDTTSTVVIPETGLSGNAEELWKMISRGGLHNFIWSRHEMLAEWTCIMEVPEMKAEFLSSGCHTGLFTETVMCLLNDDIQLEDIAVNRITCTNDHGFAKSLVIRFFNCFMKNFVRDVTGNPGTGASSQKVITKLTSRVKK